MSTEFASAGLTAGQLNAIVKKLGGHDGALKFLRGETTVPEPERSWRKEDGVIYFSVTSDGTTGEDWITRLECKDFRVSKHTKQMLRSQDFKPTSGVMTEVAVLKGLLFEDDDRITKKIRAEADKRKLTKPNAEVACLIREKFTNKEIQAMGLWYIVVMHEPIMMAGRHLLRVDRSNLGSSLGEYGIGQSDDMLWHSSEGFAFAVSESRV